MDYYHQLLRAHLTESRPDLVAALGHDDFFSLLETRSAVAAATFEQTRRDGYDVNTAQEVAIRRLIEGLESGESPLK